MKRVAPATGSGRQPGRRVPRRTGAAPGSTPSRGSPARGPSPRGSSAPGTAPGDTGHRWPAAVLGRAGDRLRRTGGSVRVEPDRPPRSRGATLLLLLLGAVVAAALAWVLLASPLLAVDRVLVTGTGRATPAQVLAAAGIAPGTPLARLDAGGVRERVEALAPVRRVEVVRSWPSTVRLRVSERVAVVGVGAPGSFRLLDGAGAAFATEPRLPPGAARLQVARPGPADPTTRSALAVLAEVPADLRARVAIVRAGSPEGVSLLLRDGREVVWGGPGRAADKATATEALLRLPGTRYDVSSPDVVVRAEVPSPGPAGVVSPPGG